MVELIAVKSFAYGTRRLKAGSAFSARTRPDAAALVAVGAASYATTAAVASDDDGDLAKLRAVYQDKVGKRPYHGWDAAALQAKIAEA